jgi:hypothetical protein
MTLARILFLVLAFAAVVFMIILLHAADYSKYYFCASNRNDFKPKT